MQPGEIMHLSNIDNNHHFDFGRTSENYAKFRNIYPQSMYERLIGYGIGKKGQEILDLGSGTAILPMNLAHTGASFTATDIAQNQIEYGRRICAKKGLDRIRFKVCAAEDTGFADNSFDAVTAVQCFPYFDKEKAAEEIRRVLKPGGLFCIVLMDWLPDEDAVIDEMVRTVKRYSPDWSEKGFSEEKYRFPSWAKDRFEMIDVCSYDEALAFSREGWLGRVLSCRGIGASLNRQTVLRFEEEYRASLMKYEEPLMLKHRLHIEVYKRLP